jgi:hypothetical protein
VNSPFLSFALTLERKVKPHYFDSGQKAIVATQQHQRSDEQWHQLNACYNNNQNNNNALAANVATRRQSQQQHQSDALASIGCQV